jgi:hypothetical protein
MDPCFVSVWAAACFLAIIIGSICLLGWMQGIVVGERGINWIVICLRSMIIIPAFFLMILISMQPWAHHDREACAAYREVQRMARLKYEEKIFNERSVPIDIKWLLEFGTTQETQKINRKRTK